MPLFYLAHFRGWGRNLLVFWKNLRHHNVLLRLSELYRIVPNQTPEAVEEIVLKYLNKKWAERGSTNSMKAYMPPNGGGPCFYSDPDHPNYLAGRRATKTVYGVEPDLTRSGGSIPVTLTLHEATGKNVILLPMGASDDGAHSQNEKINVKNYIQGTKLLSTYMYELSQL